jgi:DNA-directed RNA polymerase subunit K/omega
MGDYVEITINKESYPTKKHKTKLDDKVTDPVLNQYEYARLLSCRSKQLSLGFSYEVEWNEPFDPIKIARHEIEQRVVPLFIERKIPDASEPNGYRIEIWDLKDMDIRDY